MGQRGFAVAQGVTRSGNLKAKYEVINNGINNVLNNGINNGIVLEKTKSGELIRYF